MVKKDFKFIYLLLLFILLFTPNAYAADFNMNNNTSATYGGTKNRYRGLEIYNSGSANTYTFGTRYSGKLSLIETYFDYPFEENTTYTLTYNMNTEDFRNNFGSSYWWDCTDNATLTNMNAHLFIPTYVSYKKVKFSFTPTENTTCIGVELRSTSVSNTAITGVSNWRLDSITIYDPDWQGSGGSSGGQGTATPPPSTPDPTQQIIDNQSQNTQDIIENNNSNTQAIIDNQNNIFTDKCTNLFGYRNYYRIANNAQASSVTDDSISITSNTDWSFLGYEIPVEVGKTYYVSGRVSSNNQSSTGMVWVGSSEEVDGNETPNNYLYYENNGNFSTSFVASTNMVYVRLYGTKNVVPNTIIYYQFMLSEKNTPYCKYGSSVSNKIDNINDSLTNDSVESGVGSDFFDDFATSDNGGISAIVTKPLTIVNQLLSNNGQCTNLQLPNILGVEGAYFPSGCILWNHATPIMVSLWNAFVCGLASYYILKDLFVIVENLKDPENDKVEVIDL